tara:strand:- start:566 stop:907 length:342 start_codon:yes stop_codon:yes gene_type:complete
MKYVYYDPDSRQVMAIFDTPNVSSQKNWENKGFLRALVDNGLDVDRDCKIKDLRIVSGDDDVITSVDYSKNPQQAVKPSRARFQELEKKLESDTISEQEIRELLRIERGLTSA